ncbi:DUF2950 domain-containing protein [Teichococcus coralli]|uniref:DUF2950 domain-containing protein n=1 Tax=Teichococcus coralli TaxID=2545983 RepID=UPI0019262A5D|nr:DUF2950 domain-containing protein [Pseudoroseomonas coralli]
MDRTSRLALIFLGVLAATPAGAQVQPPATASEPTAEPARPAAPRPIPPRAFRSPQEGFTALITAMRAHDERALLGILGTAGARLIRSGDRVADRAARDQVITAYDARNEILQPGPDEAVLQVGTDDWEMPLPMVRRGNTWRFDSAAATQEIVDRRIGNNELDTIETLRAMADAQQDYARTAGRQGGLRAYARRFFSTPGHRDGLYWPAAEGEPESPLGPLAAAASAGGYDRAQRGERPEPYQGYVYRILERQGPAAPGGAMDYVVNGRMMGGFAIIAAPARYGSTGIKTFMISHDGVVWEQDLGPATEREAAAIKAFNPDKDWQRVSE